MWIRSCRLYGLFALTALASACGTKTVVRSTGAGADDAGAAVAVPCTGDTDCLAGKEICDIPVGTCTATAGGVEIGSGDGSPGSVVLTEIYSTRKSAELTDLQFSGSERTQLWAIGYGNDSVHVGLGVSETEKGTWKEFVDPAAGHFMHKPPAIAWGTEGFWGICGDNDNAQNDPQGQPNYFMGPALFSSDLDVFAKATAGGLGSHYDMLHNTSKCRGIAHAEDNVFWTFNGEVGSLDRYDFKKPHAPGADDHSDGEILRYARGVVKGVEGVSSHLFFDVTDRYLYVADTGNKRIIRLDTSSGMAGAPLPRQNEPLVKNALMKDAKLEEIVASGILEQPSGLEIHGGLLYVTDAATGFFHVFDRGGRPVRQLDTGLGPEALSGFAFGPDGKIWFTDRSRGKVLRIDPVQ